MPTYEYSCESCGEEFEYLQLMSEAPKTTCEKCGGPLRKLLSAGSGLIFKGSGFYITDYKNTGSESKGDAKPDAKAGESKPADAKPGEKPASGTETKSAPATPKSDSTTTKKSE